MATKERKARKRAHIPFSKPAKIGTPFEQRHIPIVADRADPIPHRSRRQERKLKAYREAVQED